MRSERGRNSAQFGEQGLLDGVDAAFAVEFDVFGLALVGQLLEEVGGGQGTVGGIVINVVALVDGVLVLVVAARGKLGPADPAFVAVGLDGVNKDIVGVVVVFLAETAAP